MSSGPLFLKLEDGTLVPASPEYVYSPPVVPAGAIWPYCNAVAPTDWFLVDGSTIVDCAGLYSALWDAAPVAWKVGIDLVMSDMMGEGRVARGNDGVAPLGTDLYSNFKGAITLDQMPSHLHTVATHGHTFSATSAAESAAHTHAQSHTHRGDSSSSSSVRIGGAGGNLAGMREDFWAATTSTPSPANSNPHIHSVPAVSAAVTTGPDKQAHTHTVNGTSAVLPAAASTSAGADIPADTLDNRSLSDETAWIIYSGISTAGISGEGGVQPPPTPPLEPSNVEIEPTEVIAELVLTWEPPVGFSPVDSYEIEAEITPGQQDYVSLTDDGLSASYVWPLPDEEDAWSLRKMRVRAVNTGGHSPWINAFGQPLWPDPPTPLPSQE